MPITIPILLVFSLILSIYSVKFYNINASIIGALFASPAVYYLMGTPMFSSLIIVVPLFQFASTYFISKKKTKMAWLMLVPLFLVVIWMIVIYFV